MPRTVLLVDDDEQVLEALSSLLDVHGIEVVTASSGEAALAALETRSFGLIVSDYKMPGMSGLDLLKQAARRAPGVARILITAFADPAVATEAAHRAGVMLVISKPLQPAYFAHVCRLILDDTAPLPNPPDARR